MRPFSRSGENHVEIECDRVVVRVARGGYAGGAEPAAETDADVGGEAARRTIRTARRRSEVQRQRRATAGERDRGRAVRAYRRGPLYARDPAVRRRHLRADGRRGTVHDGGGGESGGRGVRRWVIGQAG